MHEYRGIEAILKWFYRLQVWGQQSPISGFHFCNNFFVITRWRNYSEERPLDTSNTALSKCVVCPFSDSTDVHMFDGCSTFSPDLISRLRDTGIFASSPHGVPNHVILNEVSTPTPFMLY